MKKFWQNKLLKGSFAMILLSVTNVAFGEVNAKDFSAKNPPHLPPANVAQFEDGRDYFHIKNRLNKPKEAIVKFRSSFSLIMTVEFVLQPKTSCNFIAKFDLIKWH